MTKSIPLDQAYVEAKKRGQEIGLSSLNCPFVTSSIHAQHFLTNLKTKFPETTSDVKGCDAFILWSDHMYDSFVKVHNVLTETGEFKKPIFIMEDGFLRSVDIYSSKNGIEYNKKWALSCSYTLSSFPHYDIREETDLEKLIKTKGRLSLGQTTRASKAINFLKTNKISKYNNQKNSALSGELTSKLRSPNKSNYKILILDQAFGDQSVLLSEANKETFQKMLDEALKITNNVSIKVHPEQFVGRRKGYYSIERTDEQVFVSSSNYPSVLLIGEPVNPFSLITQFDEVWTCSSQLGFEALFSGIKVRTFGLPFYAGYGLTIDDKVNHKVLERRNKDVTLEQLFYRAYIDYTTYCNPFCMSDKWSIEDACEFLKEQSHQWNAIK